MNGEPKTTTPGQVLTLSTAERSAGDPTLLALVDLNGIPGLIILGGIGAFGPDGTHSLSATIPPALSGISLGFQAFARDAAGNLITTAVETISFQ